MLNIESSHLGSVLSINACVLNIFRISQFLTSQYGVNNFEAVNKFGVLVGKQPKIGNETTKIKMCCSIKEYGIMGIDGHRCA